MISPSCILESAYTAAKLLFRYVCVALASPTPREPTYLAPLTKITLPELVPIALGRLVPIKFYIPD